MYKISIVWLYAHVLYLVFIDFAKLEIDMLPACLGFMKFTMRVAMSFGNAAFNFPSIRLSHIEYHFISSQ